MPTAKRYCEILKEEQRESSNYESYGIYDILWVESIKICSKVEFKGGAKDSPLLDSTGGRVKIYD